MTKKGIVRLIAVLIAVAMPVFTALSVSADEEQGAYQPETKYESPEINDLTGLGQEPEDISVTAGAEYLEKAWYEYVMYSDKAVASYRINDDMRLLFYDPYTYTNAMVMKVENDAASTEFDTMSSYTISKTKTKTMSSCVASTDSDSEAIQTSGRDKTYSKIENGGTTKTTYNHNIEDETSGTVKEYTDYTYILKDNQSITNSMTTTAGSETEIEVGLDLGVTEKIIVGAEFGESVSHNYEWVTDRETNTTDYGAGYKTTTKYTGDDTVEYDTNSTTTGWTELSARITKTSGSSRSTSTTWSEEEGVTITKTYAATHFAADGVTPLPWAVVHYEVQMPMKCVMQVKHSGEWINVSTTYCMLTTIKGTCRAWMENGQEYYEDWGSGEPVVASDFWREFMNLQDLLAMYTGEEVFEPTEDSKKLFPTGGVS